MTPRTRLARVGGLAIALTLICAAAQPLSTLVAPFAPPPSTVTAAQLQDVQRTDAGTYRLAADAPPAPRAAGSYDHYGFAISPTFRYSQSFSSLQADFQAIIPTNSAASLDVRISADGQRWSAWETDVTSGALVTFPISGSHAQYRVRLMGGTQSPQMLPITLTPHYTPRSNTAHAAEEPVAPTYKIRATRQGMIGGRTANGHIITPKDRFVSLPSWRSLSGNRKNPEYFVRLTANGRSTVVPVMDVGPWNENDNYWDEVRARYKDLPRGYPQDHAAFFDGYNGGMAEKGRVRFPTAVDIGDGAWWDDLGLRGDQGTVEITFLWLGRDPMADQQPPAPPPAEAAPAPADGRVFVGVGSKGFESYAKVTWYDKKGDCTASGRTLWTYTSPTEKDSENGAAWRAKLPAGEYDVEVFIPSCRANKGNSTKAHYVIKHRDGTAEVNIDQAANAGKWVSLGRLPFDGNAAVELSDITGEEMRAIWFDAVRWTPAK